MDGIEKVFFDKIEKTESCWIWKGAKLSDGYGGIRFKRKLYRAHRVCYELMCGKPKREHGIFHKCDNRICVNPEHLWAGPQVENVRDMWFKNRNRAAVGEDAGNHKLTEKQVLEIRKKHIPNVYTWRMLSKEYGVKINTIYLIVARKTWKHI